LKAFRIRIALDDFHCRGKDRLPECSNGGVDRGRNGLLRQVAGKEEDGKKDEKRRDDEEPVAPADAQLVATVVVLESLDIALLASDDLLQLFKTVVGLLDQVLPWQHAFAAVLTLDLVFRVKVAFLKMVLNRTKSTDCHATERLMVTLDAKSVNEGTKWQSGLNQVLLAQLLPIHWAGADQRATATHDIIVASIPGKAIIGGRRRLEPLIDARETENMATGAVHRLLQDIEADAALKLLVDLVRKAIHVEAHLAKKVTNSPD